MKKHPLLFAAVSLAVIGCAGKTSTEYVQDPSFDQEQEWAEGCSSNIKQLSVGVLIYMTDYDDVFPPTDWEAVSPYINSYRIKACPPEFVFREEHYSYAFNRDLLGVSSTGIEDVANHPMFFEVDADVPYMVDDFSNILTTSRHKGEIYWTAADSSLKVIQTTP